MNQGQKQSGGQGAFAWIKAHLAWIVTAILAAITVLAAWAYNGQVSESPAVLRSRKRRLDAAQRRQTMLMRDAELKAQQSSAARDAAAARKRVDTAKLRIQSLEQQRQGVVDALHRSQALPDLAYADDFNRRRSAAGGGGR